MGPEEAPALPVLLDDTVADVVRDPDLGVVLELEQQPRQQRSGKENNAAKFNRFESLSNPP